MEIRARRLGFSYRRGEPVLEDLDLDLSAGALYGLSGPSGRGKSTLLYLLGLLARPTCGTIVIDGVAVGDRPDRERSSIRARQIGFLFQDALLNPARSIVDNVLEGVAYLDADPAAHVDEARATMERLGVTVPVTRRPGQISGGQAQRVALARALLKRPALLLADEPTGNLDRDSAHTVMEELVHEARGRGAICVVASHDPSILDRCDTVISL